MEHGPPISIRSNSQKSIQGADHPKESVQLPEPAFGLIEDNKGVRKSSDNPLQIDDQEEGGVRLFIQLTPKMGLASSREMSVQDDQLMINERKDPVYEVNDLVAEKTHNESYQEQPDSQFYLSDANRADEQSHYEREGLRKATSEETVMMQEKPEPDYTNTIGLKIVDLGLDDKFDIE